MHKMVHTFSTTAKKCVHFLKKFEVISFLFRFQVANNGPVCESTHHYGLFEFTAVFVFCFCGKRKLLRTTTNVAQSNWQANILVEWTTDKKNEIHEKYRRGLKLKTASMWIAERTEKKKKSNWKKKSIRFACFFSATIIRWCTVYTYSETNKI